MLRPNELLIGDHTLTAVRERQRERAEILTEEDDLGAGVCGETDERGGLRRHAVQPERVGQELAAQPFVQPIAVALA